MEQKKVKNFEYKISSIPGKQGWSELIIKIIPVFEAVLEAVFISNDGLN